MGNSLELPGDRIDGLERGGPRATYAILRTRFHDVKEYPDAGHAFLNDHEGAGDRNPVIFVVMGAFAGPSGYHEPSARDARSRIVAFFSKHLKP